MSFSAKRSPYSGMPSFSRKSPISDARSAARRGDLRILESLSDPKKGSYSRRARRPSHPPRGSGRQSPPDPPTCVVCHRPPLGAGTPHRVSSSAACPYRQRRHGLKHASSSLAPPLQPGVEAQARDSSAVSRNTLLIQWDPNSP